MLQYWCFTISSEVLHLTRLSCAGDTGAFTEDMTVLVNITNVSVTTAPCEEVLGPCSVIAAGAVRQRLCA